MKFLELELAGAFVVEREPQSDERGSFARHFCAEEFAAHGLDARIAQCNVSHNPKRGTLRGLHYQITRPQGKLTRVVAGEIFSVAVDLRRSSPTFGRWISSTLSAENGRQLWLPPGMAHGFLALSESATLVYRCTDYYTPDDERTVRWDDPDLGIDWPLPPDAEPLLSDKDRVAPTFAEADTYP